MEEKGWSRNCSEVALHKAVVSALVLGQLCLPRVGGWVDSGSGCQGCSGCVGSRPQLFFSAPPDTVKFGEVALQPPELTAKPRMSTSRDQVSRGRGVTLLAPWAAWFRAHKIGRASCRERGSSPV